ncbi:hypothetical protein [Amycolatopsis magusensis]|uniref:DUF3040 domain-containing protein n=1 Tax=Amycolatopsis magusensis TaxID=882444 RepID=A0ABS4PWQ6_9PSEU|nr:hypothetical protein [Amycolatopsis magusensis]MBP2183293.1 hypothetical protein [Amycolatopsis magusensis]MDI5975419.1 hypothetical protein [Amycolatopsis magusensis]
MATMSDLVKPIDPPRSGHFAKAGVAWPHDARTWTAWATMCIGLCLMFLTVVALFGGASAAFGFVFGSVGAGALVHGWRSGGPHSTVD